MSAKIGVLVVTYNRLELLKSEIRSIRSQTYKDFKIVVVNNCSTDGTKEWLKGENDITTINIEPRNIGPAAAFAEGIKFIAEQGFEFCWLMDDDVECYPDSLEQLVSAYKKKERIGFLCSKVIGLQGEPMNVPSVDDRPTINGYPDYADLLSEQMLKVKQCTFVSMFIPCYLIFKIGLPYKDFYNWGVDTEYSLRLSQKNDSYMVNKSIVVHKRIIQANLDFNTEKDPVRIAYYRSSFRNDDFIAIKYTNRSKPYYLLKGIIKAIRLLLKGDFRQSKVVLQAAMDLLNFNPSIEYPSFNR